MPTIDQYIDDNDCLRLLLQGESGAGKTSLACQLPDAWVFDFDRNLAGTIRWMKEQIAKGAKLKLPIGYDIMDRDEKDQILPISKRFSRFQVLLDAAVDNPAVKTLVFDSGTTMTDVFIAEILRQRQKTDMTKMEWNFFAQLSRQFLGALSAARKHVVLIVHEKTKTDEKGNVVYPIQVNWPGQVGQNMGAFFTNVWRCEARSLPDGPGKTKTERYLRTEPDGKYSLKNTLGLPCTFAFSWPLIESKLTQPVALK